MNRRGYLVWVLTLVVAGAVWLSAACDGGQAGGTLRVALISDPIFLDPVNLQDDRGLQIGDCLFDSLTKFDSKTGELLPSVAESWTANEDATVWTFNLREGTKFHDGSTVTAGDFKYGWERICDPDNLSEISYHLAAVKGYQAMRDGAAAELEGVVAVDDYTLEVTLSYGMGDFEFVVGHPALAPVPQAAVEGDGEYSEKPIGNGPFMMVEPWAHGEYIKVSRFDDYYGEKAHVDGVDFIVYQDEVAAYRDFQAGNLDFSIVPPAEIESARSEYGLSEDGLEAGPERQFLWGPELAPGFMSINCTDEVLGNEALRQALSLAVNRKAIANAVYEGAYQPASGIVPPGIPGYLADQWEYCRYDVESAEDKLAEAGYPNGQGLAEIVVVFPSEADVDDVMQLIRSDWESIGVKIKLESLAFAQYAEALYSGDYQIAQVGWGADYPIMGNFLFPLFYSESGDNFSLWSDSVIDARLVAAATIVNTKERIAEYQEIERVIGESSPVIPVVVLGHRHVVSERVRSLVFSPMTLWNLNEVWLAE
jgi:oligopeptide transport system substrate-binding protein